MKRGWKYSLEGAEDPAKCDANNSNTYEQHSSVTIAEEVNHRMGVPDYGKAVLSPFGFGGK